MLEDGQGVGVTAVVREDGFTWDGFNETFQYNTVETFYVEEGNNINYLQFNFEEILTAPVLDNQPIASDDDFDYNQVQPVYQSDGVIDYTAPLLELSPGYLFGFILTVS